MHYRYTHTWDFFYSPQLINFFFPLTIFYLPDLFQNSENCFVQTQTQHETGFKADNPADVKVDDDGFVLKEPGETQEQFVQRLTRVSTEFNQVTAATDWLDKEINNSIYYPFLYSLIRFNITDY